MSETATGQSKLADWTLTPEGELTPAERTAALLSRLKSKRLAALNWLESAQFGDDVTLNDDWEQRLAQAQTCITALREAHPGLAGSRQAVVDEIMRAVDHHADLSSNEYSDLADVVAGILARRL